LDWERPPLSRPTPMPSLSPVFVAVLQYLVYCLAGDRDATVAEAGVCVHSTPALSFVHTNLPAATPHTYAIVCVTRGGYSSYSSVATARTSEARK
jgi:hypothetical protein